MPKIKVRLYAALREIAGESEVVIDTPQGISVKEMMRSFFEQYEEKFKERYGFSSRKDDVEKRFLVFVNDAPIYSLDGFDTKLKEGDKVDILEPISGG